MPDSHVKLDPLALGRGKRPKLNHQTVGMRMSVTTKQNLEKIARSYDCLYGGKPWIAGLLEKIAAGDLIVVPAPPSLVPDPETGETAAEMEKSSRSLNSINPRQAMKNRLKHKHYTSAPPNEGASSNCYDDNSTSLDVSRYTR